MSPSNGSRRDGIAAGISADEFSLNAAEFSDPHASTQADLAIGNSLADLAARIRAEHEAAAADFNSGLRHAIAAGEMLIEAKAQLAHGQWLPWVTTNCTVSERTAQAYMRVARTLNNLGDQKAQHVADLSFRDALRSLATAGSILNRSSPESCDRALAMVQGEDGRGHTLQQALRRARIEEIAARHPGSLETPPSMLPSAEGRKICVARNAAKRQWLLAIGPNISRTELLQKEQAAREMPIVHELLHEHTELIDRAAELEAEAKALREDAKAVQTQISAEIKSAVGPALPFTETFDFQADEETDAEIAALPQQKLLVRLLSARGTVGPGLAETKRGWWGDMQFMSYQPPIPGPGTGFDGIGSPEWLDELFPNWNQPDDNNGGAP